MASTSTYLNFKNQTEEAFNFYRSVFGGNFRGEGILRFGNIPPAPGQPELPEQDKNLIMHIELELPGQHVLMGSDAPESLGFKINNGNNHHLHVQLDTKEETDRIFNQLSDKGHVIMAMQETFWGAYYGNCVDKFGIQWMVSCPK